MRKSLIAIGGILAVLLSTACGGGSSKNNDPAQATLRCSEICTTARECEGNYTGPGCESQCATTSAAFSPATNQAVNACLGQQCDGFQGCLKEVLPTCSGGTEDVSTWVLAIREALTDCGFSPEEAQYREEQLVFLPCLSTAARDALATCAGTVRCGLDWDVDMEDCVIETIPLFQEIWEGHF